LLETVASVVGGPEGMLLADVLQNAIPATAGGSLAGGSLAGGSCANNSSSAIRRPFIPQCSGEDHQEATVQLLDSVMKMSIEFSQDTRFQHSKVKKFNQQGCSFLLDDPLEVDEDPQSHDRDWDDGLGVDPVIPKYKLRCFCEVCSEYLSSPISIGDAVCAGKLPKQTSPLNAKPLTTKKTVCISDFPGYLVPCVWFAKIGKVRTVVAGGLYYLYYDAPLYNELRSQEEWSTSIRGVKLVGHKDPEKIQANVQEGMVMMGVEKVFQENGKTYITGSFGNPATGRSCEAAIEAVKWLHEGRIAAHGLMAISGVLLQNHQIEELPLAIAQYKEGAVKNCGVVASMVANSSLADTQVTNLNQLRKAIGVGQITHCCCGRWCPTVNGVAKGRPFVFNDHYGYGPYNLACMTVNPKHSGGVCASSKKKGNKQAVANFFDQDATGKKRSPTEREQIIVDAIVAGLRDELQTLNQRTAVRESVIQKAVSYAQAKKIAAADISILKRVKKGKGAPSFEDWKKLIDGLSVSDAHWQVLSENGKDYFPYKKGEVEVRAVLRPSRTKTETTTTSK